MMHTPAIGCNKKHQTYDGAAINVLVLTRRAHPQEKTKGAELLRESAPFQPHIIKFLKIAILGCAHEPHLFSVLNRSRRHARFRIIRHKLPLEVGTKPDGAFRIISPAVRIRIFFAGMVQAANLIFEPVP